MSETWVLTDSYVKFNKEPHFNDEPLKVSKEMEKAGWVYRDPCTVYLKQKKALSESICKKAKIITLHNEHNPIDNAYIE